MKNLKIVYNETTLFDGPVEEFAWQDSAQQVSAVGKLKRQTAPSGGGLLDLLAGARKERTAALAEERRQELAAERDQELDTDDSEAQTA